MPRRALCALLALLAAWVPARAQPPEAPVVAGLRAYLGTFAPLPGEQSLLAHAQREGLDWAAFQNLFAAPVTDPAGAYLDWRGHSDLPGGAVFTTLRAAVYDAPSGRLLVVGREWCRAGVCTARTAFLRLAGGAWTAVPEPQVIPAIRDADLLASPAPGCLRGVHLGLRLLPARSGPPGLSALAAVPREAAERCAALGIDAEAPTRALRLNWTPSVGKFRR